MQARIAELQRELEHVGNNIEALDRAVNTPDQEAALRRLRRIPERQERRVEETPRGPLKPEPAPTFTPVPPPAEEPDGVEPGESPEAKLPRVMPDRRFASYFVTGSLQSVRPLRTERRIQRNKAIIMVIFAVILLYGVLSVLFAHR